MSTEANLVFNNNLRVLAQEYFTRANTALRFSDFWAVRVTSGGKSETLYPQGGKYWAFDANAQNGTNLPASMPRNPFPGFKPGTAGLTAPQMTHGSTGTSGRSPTPPAGRPPPSATSGSPATSRSSPPASAC